MTLDFATVAVDAHACRRSTGSHEGRLSATVGGGVIFVELDRTLEMVSHVISVDFAATDGHVLKGFERFVAASAGDLRRIAHRTRGEYSEGDLQSEGWLIGIEIGNRRGWPVDFDDSDDRDEVLAWLFTRFVKHAPRTLRFATRLDASNDDDAEATGSALARLLTAPVESDPQFRQQIQDESKEILEAARRSYSQAAAYVVLLIRVDWHLSDLADLLRVGVSALRARMKACGLLARVQPTLFDGVELIDEAFEPLLRRRTIPVNRWFGCSGQLRLPV